MNPILFKQVLLEQACKFAHLESTAIFILSYCLYKSCAFWTLLYKWWYLLWIGNNTDLFEHLCNVLTTLNSIYCFKSIFEGFFGGLSMCHRLAIMNLPYVYGSPIFFSHHLQLIILYFIFYLYFIFLYRYYFKSLELDSHITYFNSTKLQCYNQLMKAIKQHVIQLSLYLRRSAWEFYGW